MRRLAPALAAALVASLVAAAPASAITPPPAVVTPTGGACATWERPTSATTYLHVSVCASVESGRALVLAQRADCTRLETHVECRDGELRGAWSTAGEAVRSDLLGDRWALDAELDQGCHVRATVVRSGDWYDATYPEPRAGVTPTGQAYANAGPRQQAEARATGTVCDWLGAEPVEATRATVTRGVVLSALVSR